MINGAILGNAEFLRPMGGDIPDGIILNSWHLPDYPDTPGNRRFTKHYLDMTGDSYVRGCASQAYIASKVLFEAIKKAKSSDVEKVVAALETIEMETPRSTTKLSIRKCDHKSNMGEIWGTTRYDKNLGYTVLTNPKYISAESFRHSCEEVIERRAKSLKK